MKLHGLKKIQCLAFADDSQTECENLSWSAHYANLQEYLPKPSAMMNLVKQIPCQVNPEQIPVFTVDQPLYMI